MVPLKVLLTISWLANVIYAEGFVEEFSCNGYGLDIVLNKTDPEVKRWTNDPEAQPIVYVDGHKSHPPCAAAMKKGNSINYNFTIPYGNHCNVKLTDLQPSHRYAHTKIAIENNADNSPLKTIRRHHIYCLYNNYAQATSVSNITSDTQDDNTDDDQDYHQDVAFNVGKRNPKVDIFFLNKDGRQLRAAKFGHIVNLYVALSDKGYHGFSPKECMFSDREDMLSPYAGFLPFVKKSCPVDDVSDFINPLENDNDKVYFSKFKAFRISNEPIIFVHCIVKLCLTAAECAQNCFKRISNSNATAERLRFRHRRQLDDNYVATVINKQKSMNEVNVTRPLTILHNVESIEVTDKKVEQSPISSAIVPLPIIILILCLSILSIVCLTGLIVTLQQLAVNKKLAPYQFGLYNSYSGPIVPLPVRSLSDCATRRMDHHLSTRIDHPYIREMY